MSSQSSNAILAKARAMYGKCLKDSDYQQLTECKSVSEVTAYLKSRTCYSGVLNGLNENEIHRGQLEPVLRQNIYFDLSALSRYGSEKTLAFSEFIISKMEIDQIVRCLMLINIGKAEEYVLSSPFSLERFAGISFKKLAGVRSYDDMLEVLRGSKYYSALCSFKPKDKEKIRITELEIALDNKNYERILETILNSKNKGDGNELKEVFSAMLDFENMSRILRLKKYYKFEPERIKPLLIPYGKLSERMLDEFCSAETVSEVFELSRTTYLGKLMSKMEYNSQTQLTDVMINSYCKHHLRLSPNPAIVMISYIYLKEIELKNIINIIEATRYGISVDEKLKLLVR